MGQMVIIIGTKLKETLRGKRLYDTEGKLKLEPSKKGGKAISEMLAQPGIYTVNKGTELYAGFVVADTTGEAKQGTNGKTLYFRDDVMSLDENPSPKKLGIEQKLREPMKEAQRRWNDFTIAVKEAHGIELGSGELLMLMLKD